ncbi:MAG: GNAT family N-acetyltransferase [Pyrinomonadaceae bacterium]|nr:GNAT family N-acetyltransferase [Pyrinomonadaceae bacterium]
MVELQPDDFLRVLPLYRSAGKSFPLISAVIQNKQRGQIFADTRENPRAAIIVTNFGFMFLTGEECESFDDELARVFTTSGKFKPSYLLWYSPPEGWQARLDSIPDLGRRRERVRLDFRPDQAGWLGEPVDSPAGFELKDLSSELIPKTEKFGVKLDSRFWGSTADFLKNGFGVCLMRDHEIVSVCYAAAVADGLAEVDVATDEEFRGRGFAGVVTREFIRQCLDRGLAPTWDCFTYNTSSLKLAKSLGFAGEARYPFYSFNVPIKS